MHSTTPLKKRTNLSINEKTLKEAKELGVNLSKAAENGILKALQERKQDIWLAENEAAIASSNAFVEKQRVPLDKFRHF
jgi:antitoxin CcdA